MSKKSNWSLSILYYASILTLSLLVTRSYSASQAFRRDPGHPQWHHGAFHDVRDGVRSDVRRMLHTRGGSLDARKLDEFLRTSFPSHRSSCLGTSEPLDIEHHVVFKAFPEAMVPAGTARETDFGREVPLFEVEAAVVEPVFHKLYSYIFDMENMRYTAAENDRPVPNAIFIVNFDKVRMDPRDTEIDLDSLMYRKINPLTNEEIGKQEGNYVYRYRYNGGGATQVWLSSDRFVVIDLSAGPCTYGNIETEEGSVSSRTLPWIQNMMFPGGVAAISDHVSHDIFVGQLAALIATTVEHVIAPDIRFETVDLATRLLIPIIVLQNHNRYNVMEKGHNYSINIEEIESEVKKMVHDGPEVVIVGGSHALHSHEKLAIAVSKAMQGHSLQETKKDGRFHVHTKTYLDGAALKEMERSADVLAAGLVELADPSLSIMFRRQRRHALPSIAQRHILAGLTSAVGGLSAPYEKASHVHERPIVNGLWAAGCHPFGPFSNTSKISKLLKDVALRNTIYARVDSAFHRIRDTSEGLDEQLVDLSSLLYDYWLQDVHQVHVNSSEIPQSSMFTQQYVDHVLANERVKMKCYETEYKYPIHSSQTCIYGENSSCWVCCIFSRHFLFQSCPLMMPTESFVIIIIIIFLSTVLMG
ncbi:hypothetical protein P3X46_005848 [Hevea brasiliensis]|uniref:DUF7906 domain-containing protein n=1 Tax=Hevea brasiliensis TaxID=3981 RepID=A0ABQ9MQX8_HEVBR|nr:hypothetical protein P3X46_005848 [Hevea brasiliensis]